MSGQQAVRGLLIRGMLVGLAAGVLMFAFAKIFGEPAVDKAIAFEEATSPPSDEAPLVSRAMQSTLGLLTGTVVYGVALGGIFALVFAAVYGRVGHARPRITAAMLALVAFTVIILVPFLKYPSNPPAVGADDTIGYRTQIYFAMLAISVAAAIAALRIGRDTVKRFGAWNGTLLARRRLPRPGRHRHAADARPERDPGELPRRRDLGLPRRHPRHPRRALRDARPRLRRPRRALAQGPAAAAGTYRTSSLSAGAPHS